VGKTGALEGQIWQGGTIDVIVWQTGTARLLPRLIKGRMSGPLFLTERRARVELAPGDIDQALFKACSGGRTLHQSRHSALTHDEGRGVAFDASFPGKREDDAVRDGGRAQSTATGSSRRESAGQRVA
jgi:hypothetical protein